MDCVMKNIKKAKLAALKIRPAFPCTPHGNLMFAIVEGALVEANRAVKDPANRIDAQEYLAGEMIHCELAGVCSDWVKLKVQEVFDHYK